MNLKLATGICDFVKDGILITDKDYKVVFANKALLEIYGKGLDKFIGSKCHEALHSLNDPCAGICPHKEIFLKGKSSLTVSRAFTNGKQRSFEVCASPILDGSGNVVRMVEIFKDVTARERLRDEFIGTVDLYHSVLDTLAEGVLVIDGDFRIVMANRGYLNHLGVENAEGRLCYELSHGADNPCPEKSCPVRRVFKTGKPASEVHIHKDKDGGEIHVSVNAFPIKNSSGEVYQAVETVTDITEKKKADDELRERIRELQEFYDMAVGRELKMAELKTEIERLRGELDASRGRDEDGR